MPVARVCNRWLTSWSGGQVFSQVRVTGSVGGRYFNTGPVVFYTLGGGVFHARNVTVPLKQLLARHLRLQLTFASDWLLVSEVTFISGQSTQRPDVASAHSKVRSHLLSSLATGGCRREGGKGPYPQVAKFWPIFLNKNIMFLRFPPSWSPPPNGAPATALELDWS